MTELTGVVRIRTHNAILWTNVADSCPLFVLLRFLIGLELGCVLDLGQGYLFLCKYIETENTSTLVARATVTATCLFTRIAFFRFGIDITAKILRVTFFLLRRFFRETTIRLSTVILANVKGGDVLISPHTTSAFHRKSWKG